jgi:adenylosuccinate synthase
LRVGDLVDWKTFLEKYDKFIENAMFQLHVPDFDKAKELDELRILHERMTKENMIVDSIDFMSKSMKDPNQRIIAEGANATMLDIDYGTYPYVTSSSTTIGGVCTGLGVPPSAI